MQGDLGYSSESYSDLYSPIGDHNAYVGSGDVDFDGHCLPPVTDPVDIMHFIHSMPTDLLHVPPCIDMSCIPIVPYFPPGNVSTGQRQPANQQLHINTQLSHNQLDDSESSTASSSSFQLLPTPYFQPHAKFQSFVHASSPPSGSAESGMLIPDLGDMSPFPVSPSLIFEGDIFDDPTSPLALPVESDVLTQAPMSHILEWKRVVGLCGTNDFIPQTVYQPYTEADKKRYIKDVKLHETIFFAMDDSSEWGIFLEDALKQKLLHLRDKDDLMFNGCGPSVSIRLQWPGYPAWSKQIPTMDFKTPKGPITRAKLAKNIATCIRHFFDSVQNKPMEAESDRRWKIGKQRIRVEDLILVSLHHVSRGSWQPQLRIRHSFTRFPYY